MGSVSESSSNEKAHSFFKSIRFLLGLLIFTGAIVQYAHKSDISVAIVCMVNHTAFDQLYKETQNDNDYQPNEKNKCLSRNSTQNRDIDGEFIWSKTIQEVIISSYFYGYILSQIPGGWLSFKFGPKMVFLVSMILGSVGTLLVPVCANWHYAALIVCRFLTGFSQGVMFPTLMGMWASWAPKNEKSILMGMSGAGAQIGSILGFAVGGFLCNYSSGWQSIFYSFGTVGIIWCVVWFFLAADTPSKHRFISQAEKNFIIHETISQEDSDRKKKTPWKAIITSKACISLFVTHFCHTWGSILFLTNGPTYMKEVLKFDIKTNGVLFSIPYTSCLVTIIFAGFLSDKLIKSFNVQILHVRKIFNVFGFVIPAGLIVWLSYVSCDEPYYGVALLSLGIAFSGFCNGGGYIITFNDIAGPYSGILYGISNTIANSTGIFVPYLIATLTEKKTQEEWRVVFCITAGVYLIGTLSSLIFGSAKLEPWAKNAYSEIADLELQK